MPTSYGDVLEDVNTAISGKIEIAPIPSLKLARDFIARLRGGNPDAEVCFRAFHDKGKGEGAAKREYALTEHHYRDLLELQRQGFGIFLVVNEGGHKGDEITRIRAIYTDGDGIPVPASWHVEPDFLVHRDATHWHAYWLVDDLAVENFTQAQMRLIAHYGTDPSIHDRSRVMRVPGFLHRKAEPQALRLEVLRQGPPRPAAELLEGLPTVDLRTYEKQTPPAHVVTDRADMIKEAKRYLAERIQKGELAEAGVNGNKRIFAWSCHLKELALSPETADELLWKDYNLTGGCVPAWSDPEDVSWRAPITSAYSLFKKCEFGGRFPKPAEEVFPHVLTDTMSKQSTQEAESEAKSEEARPRIRVYDEADQDALPDTTWMIKGILPDGGPTVISAPPKRGKGLVATDMCLSISSGLPVFGKLEVVRPAPTFYLTDEGFRGMARRRRPAWRQARGIDPEVRIPFYLIDSVPQAIDPTAADAYSFAIEDVMMANHEHERPGTICIDTLSKSMGELDEDKPGAANRYLAIVAALERRFDCGTLTVAHTRHDGQGVVRGSSAFRGGFDNLLKVESDEKARIMVLSSSGMKDEDDTWQHHLRSDLITLPLRPGEEQARSSFVLQWVTADEYQRIKDGSGKLFRAAVTAAIQMSEMSPPRPITKQRYPDEDRRTVIDLIEMETREPRADFNREVLPALDTAERHGLLRYHTGAHKGLSGYFRAPLVMPKKGEK